MLKLADKKIIEYDILDDSVDYGVADNVEQIFDEYCNPFMNLNDSDKYYIITTTSIKKSEQPKKNGWRWRKWGAYIGTQNPQREYLYDEENIEEVLIYTIREVEEY